MERSLAIKQLSLIGKKARRMRLAAEEWDLKWKTLIAISMSAQSRDEVTIQIAAALFKRYPSLNALSKAKYGDVLYKLRSLNYNRTKARNIIACAKMLVRDYGGVVPEDINELIKLPGVGRKTANVFLSEYNHSAIGVDTHTAYISQKLGWSKSKRPEKIESDLMELFPKKYWGKINPYLVRFGKTYTSKKEKDMLLEEIRRK
jgi:endonuclease-3